MARRLATPNGSRVIGGDQHWYKLDAGEGSRVHDRAVAHVKTLMSNSAAMHSKNRARERIYEGTELIGARAAVASLESAGVGIARLNATKTIIDTFASRLAKDKPMPGFITDDADWNLKRKAKQYRSFIVGKMRETEFDDLSTDSVLDGAIIGNAFTFVNDGENDVYAERVHVNEMLFDPRECRYGKPQSGYRVQRVARDYLAELFPEHKSDILRAPASLRRPDDVGDMMNLDDYVDTFSCWYLPSTPDSKDGRYALSLETCTLVHEIWHEPRFPWSHLKLFKPRVGLWGSGFVDQLANLQHRVNCIVRDLQLNLQATGRGHFLVNEANDVPTDSLTGWQPFKMKYKGGTPPQFVAPTPFNQAQLNALQFFIEQMFELTGVSQAAATSKSSLGAGASGVALDTQYDIDSDRFRMPQTNYARYRLDAAQRYIDAAHRVSRRRENDKGKKRSYVAVSWKNRDAIERLDYDSVKLDKEEYCLQIEPVNFLPDTRAGKLSIVEQLAKAGVIPQWLVPTLFDEPDLQQANGIMLAAFKNAMRKMDDLADETIPMPIPEPYNDLELELKIVVAYYNRVQNERAPEEIQTRFRDYADMVTDAIKQKNKPPEAPPMDPMAAGDMIPALGPDPGGVAAMPQGPLPPHEMIGASEVPQAPVIDGRFASGVRL